MFGDFIMCTPSNTNTDYSNINNNNNYTTITLLSDRFDISNTSKKKSTPREIIANIEHVIKYDLRYLKENDLKSDRLETLNTLKDIAIDVRNRYTRKTAESCRLVKWMFSAPEKQSEIESLVRRIDLLLVPPSILFPLPEEAIQHVGMFLTLGDLGRLAQTNHDGRGHALSSILSYASQHGYKGGNYPELADFMKKILQVLPPQCSIPQLQNYCYTVQGNDNTLVRLPLGEILKNLNSITHEGLFTIFSAPKGRMHLPESSGNRSSRPNDSFVNYLVNIHTHCLNIEQCSQEIKNKASLALHEAIIGNPWDFPYLMTTSQMDVFKFLLKNGINPNTVLKDGFISNASPQDPGKRYFDLCVATGRIEFVKLFIQYRADVNYQRSITRFTALHWACTVNTLRNSRAFYNRIGTKVYNDIITLLLENGANPNLPASNGDHPIHIIVNNDIVQGSNSHLDICQILGTFRKYGVNINSQGHDGYTALHLACRKSILHPETIKLLVGYGANPNIAATDNDCPIHSLVKQGSTVCYKMITLLLEFGADSFCRANIINQQGNNGYTALHLACLRPVYHSDTIKFLLFHGANTNIGDTQGDRPIHLIIAGRYNKEILDLLIKYGADINKQGNHGYTVLHLVCQDFRYISLDIIKLILSYRANPNISDNNGDYPIHLVVNNSNPYRRNICQIIDTLIQSGADINKQGNNGDTVLHLVCRQPGNHHDTIQFLLSRGANPNIANSRGELPIIPTMSV